VEARVWRKTQDLVRDAAESLLRERFPEVERVARADVWSFEVEGPDAAATESIREILEDTTLVVNPNIHRYAMEGAVAGAAGPAGSKSADAPPMGCRLLVRVHDRVDPKSGQVLRAIREHLGRKNVTAVRRSVLWSVDLATDDVAGAERTGQEMVGGERGAGILANPHAQDSETRVVKA
jgi:phosphoribosylformylglycinamidine (FGAM) synthase PurS component